MKSAGAGGMPGVSWAITELYKLDIEDPVGCARRVSYLLEENRFTCPSSNYEVVFRHSQDHF